MPFKFEKLELWELALCYIDRIYEIGEQLPRSEDFNLKSQIQRAATSIALNIAEGSTGQTDTEQGRFIGLALRSLVESVACIHLIRRRGYLPDSQILDQAYSQADNLAMKLQAFRKAIAPGKGWVREGQADYATDDSL